MGDVLKFTDMKKTKYFRYSSVNTFKSFSFFLVENRIVGLLGTVLKLYRENKEYILTHVLLHYGSVRQKLRHMYTDIKESIMSSDSLGNNDFEKSTE